MDRLLLSLEDAKKLNPEIDQLELDALEQTVRRYTNNTFQLRDTRTDAKVTGPDTVEARGGYFYNIKAGDTVQLTGSPYHEGLATVKAKLDGVLTLENLEDGELVLGPGVDPSVYVTKVKYPADVIVGVRKLIKYEAKTASHIGLKSRSVSRLSETYADPSGGQFIEGYPAGLLGFLHKYRQMRWD